MLLVAVTVSGDDCHKKKKQKTVDSKGCPYYKPVAMETLRDLSLVGLYLMFH